MANNGSISVFVNPLYQQDFLSAENGSTIPLSPFDMDRSQDSASQDSAASLSYKTNSESKNITAQEHNIERNLIFSLLAEYHLTKNVSKLKTMVEKGFYTFENGVLYNHEGFSFKPGDSESEAEYYKGFLFFVDGTLSLEQLIADEDKRAFVEKPKYIPFNQIFTQLTSSNTTLTPSSQTSAASHNSPAKKAFFDYLDDGKKDGVYFISTAQNAVYRIPELPNSYDKKQNIVPLLNQLPFDFLSAETYLNPVTEAGTKTRLAVRVPQLCDVDAVLLKRTPSTPLGIGDVLHFTKDGLYERIRLFWAYHPQVLNDLGKTKLGVGYTHYFFPQQKTEQDLLRQLEQGIPLLDKQLHIVAKYTQYKNTGTSIIPIFEQYVPAAVSSIYSMLLQTK